MTRDEDDDRNPDEAYSAYGGFGYVKVDAALIATGRAPFIKGLGLENVNVVTQRGFIPVDERMRVIDANGNLVPHVYCIGDANGTMMLAHAASAQGISASALVRLCLVIKMLTKATVATVRGRAARGEREDHAGTSSERRARGRCGDEQREASTRTTRGRTARGEREDDAGTSGERRARAGRTTLGRTAARTTRRQARKKTG